MMAVAAPGVSRPPRRSIATALVITRREIKDSLRDWRIMMPIVILTLVFPALMNVTARLAVNWVEQYNATIVGERLIPFMLMIVGFFPISFSLVIALETFVGEKERNSIEPLLSMPVTDLELYLGKILAALVVPLGASYLGISIYLVGLYFSIDWMPDIRLLAQIFLLTTAEGLVMVSGAVVISSQTTSVRAANLLASFIIIPMAFLLQGESILLFWGEYDVIWAIIVALLIVDAILIRMGVRIFNREEILAREMDTLNLRTIWRDFKGYFLRPAAQALNRNAPSPKFNVWQMWRRDIPWLLRANKVPIRIVAGLLLLSVGLGVLIAPRYPLPPGSLDLSNLSAESFERLEGTRIGFLPTFSVMGVFSHNVRVIFVSAVLAVFSFGVMPLILLMIPMVAVGFFTGAVMLPGYSPWVFLAAFIVPHGLFELPAAVIGAAFALRIGAALMSPPEGLDVGQGFLLMLANFVKIFVFLVIPMLLVAAFVEINITPQIAFRIYGG